MFCCANGLCCQRVKSGQGNGTLDTIYERLEACYEGKFAHRIQGKSIINGCTDGDKE